MNKSINKKAFYKQLATLIFIAVVLVIVLCKFFNDSFGWFAMNKNVDGTGMHTIAKSENTVFVEEPITIYTYDLKEGNAKIVEGDAAVLPKYDTVFTENNEKCTLVFRIPLYGETITNGDPFRFTVPLIDMSEVTGEEDNNYLDGDKTEDDDENAVADYLSNIISVKCAAIDDADLQSDVITPAGGKSEADFMYDKVHDYMKGVALQKSFISIETDGDGKKTFSKNTNSLVFDISDYSDAKKSSKGLLYFYIEVSYNPDLIENMISTRDMSFKFEGTENDSTLEIQGDMDVFTYQTIN